MELSQNPKPTNGMLLTAPTATGVPTLRRHVPTSLSSSEALGEEHQRRCACKAKITSAAAATLRALASYALARTFHQRRPRHFLRRLLGGSALRDRGGGCLLEGEVPRDAIPEFGFADDAVFVLVHERKRLVAVCEWGL